MTFILSFIVVFLAIIAAEVFFVHRNILKLLQRQVKDASHFSEKCGGIDLPASSTCVSRQNIHDLNNLLGTIRGFTDAVIEDLPASSPFRSDLAEVRAASQRAKALVDKLENNAEGASAVEKTGNASLQTSFTAKSASSPKCPAAERPRKPGQEHLLIVDDEAQLLNMFRRIFEPQGYQVTTFSNGLNAWDDFRKNSDIYDLAILDQRMPEMSGTNLAVEMLNYRPDFPIILLTGFSDTVGPDDAAQLGIRKFLSKPIPQNELTDTIRKTLDEPEYFAT